MRASLALIAVLVAACGPSATPTPAPSPTPLLFTLTGTMELFADDLVGGAGTCRGVGGYSDMALGTGVVVKDQSGTILATANLAQGKRVNLHCTFPFAVYGIPTATFYSIEVGHRGALTYSFAEMESRGWVVGFTLGN